MIDARGLRCPWPALRLARAMREAKAGAELLIVADDPAAPAELGALAAERGWRLAAVTTPLGPGFAAREICAEIWPASTSRLP